MRNLWLLAAAMWALLLSLPVWSADSVGLIGNSLLVFERAQQQPKFKKSQKLNPRIMPTEDEKSFVLVWTPHEWVPRRWIVSLHGSRGYATDELAIWSSLLQHRNFGFIALQWWYGSDDTGKSYYTPDQIYHELDVVLKKLRVQRGTAMLHGFSRGASNMYAVAAFDAGRGEHYFELFVASSGGMSQGFPPNKAIVSGEYGDRPLRNTHWITAAGAKDPNPKRDGIHAMKQTATWLEKQGAIVFLSIEDEKYGHGALMLNPKHIKRVLDYFGD